MISRRSFFRSGAGCLAGALSLRGLSAAVQASASPCRQPRLKITDVRTALVRGLHVRIYSDQGLVGEGEGVDAVSGNTIGRN
jgi:galactonate dehydratase